jgi:hypothetical protein
MKISSVREFRDNATSFLRSKDPILVTRRGRLAGVFFPCPRVRCRSNLSARFSQFLATSCGVK